MIIISIYLTLKLNGFESLFFPHVASKKEFAINLAAQFLETNDRPLGTGGLN